MNRKKRKYNRSEARWDQLRDEYLQAVYAARAKGYKVDIMDPSEWRSIIEKTDRSNRNGRNGYTSPNKVAIEASFKRGRTKSRDLVRKLKQKAERLVAKYMSDPNYKPSAAELELIKHGIIGRDPKTGKMKVLVTEEDLMKDVANWKAFMCALNKLSYGDESAFQEAFYN